LPKEGIQFADKTVEAKYQHLLLLKVLNDTTFLEKIKACLKGGIADAKGSGGICSFT
jgi:hypothetical protein